MRVKNNLKILLIVLVAVLLIGECITFAILVRIEKSVKGFTNLAIPLLKDSQALTMIMQDEQDLLNRIMGSDAQEEILVDLKRVRAQEARFTKVFGDVEFLTKGIGYKFGLSKLEDLHAGFLRGIEGIGNNRVMILSSMSDAAAALQTFDHKSHAIDAMLTRVIFESEVGMNQVEEKFRLDYPNGAQNDETYRRLADETFNKYFPVAKGVSRMRLLMAEVHDISHGFLRIREEREFDAQEKRFLVCIEKSKQEIRKINIRLQRELMTESGIVVFDEIAALSSLAMSPEGIFKKCRQEMILRKEIASLAAEIQNVRDRYFDELNKINAQVRNIIRNEEYGIYLLFRNIKLLIIVLLLFVTGNCLFVARNIWILWGRLDKMMKELCAAKEAADLSNEHKTKFLSNVSHEIRTPLTALIGFAELSISGGTLEQVRDNARIILSQADGLLMLVNDLLDDARIKAGKLQLDPKAFDLPHMLKMIEVSMAILAKKNKIGLCVELPGNLPGGIVLDELRLRQVLTNLLSNAVKFTLKGNVRLSITAVTLPAQKVRLKFSVIDTGIGIPDEKRKEIFERFSQGGKHVVGKYGGTGLGLNISFRLVELMGGHIQLEANPDGQGTVFWFEVEAGIDPEFRPGESEVYKAGKGLALNILVVDDSEINQRLYTCQLTAAGFRVAVAGTGAQALKEFSAQPFDLALMDINLPDMSGLQVVRELRALACPNQKIPVIALTAETDAAIRAEVEKSGMNGYMMKPVHWKELVGTITAMCSKEKDKL